MERSLRTGEPHHAVPPGRAFYRWSVAILAASSAAEVGSSWCRPEANSVLASPGFTFGAGSLAIKVGLVGSSFLVERVVLRHRPDLYRHAAWMNYGIAGAPGGYDTMALFTTTVKTPLRSSPALWAADLR